jgi:hypothetical protein
LSSIDFLGTGGGVGNVATYTYAGVNGGGGNSNGGGGYPGGGGITGGRGLVIVEY